MPHDFSIGEWLKNGWILEVADDLVAGVSKLVIGGGSRAAIRPSAVAATSGAVWSPDFFDASGASSAPMVSEWFLEIERDALVKKIENYTRSGIRPMGKVVWTPPVRTNFDAIFQRLQKAFREEGVKKAVPVVFSTGVAATSKREEWISDRLLSGLKTTRNSPLRIYGSWSDGEGFLGATPEILFRVRGDSVDSMAVAGTRAIGDDILDDPLKIESLKRELESDMKDRNEHDLVVSDIEAVLSRITGAVVKSGTRVEPFGRLLHLVTDIEGRRGESAQSISVEDLLKALHPTPALGVSPRQSSLSLLRELDSLSGSSAARKNFGAPFVVSFENTVHAVVAIRQIRWSFRGIDQIDLVLGAGCGVVPESNCDKEWRELESKRAAVARLFRLSPESPRPVQWSLSMVDRLLDFGVRTFVVCAGARNAPLVVALDAISKLHCKLEKTPILKMETFFEERAAAFYALGLARGLGEPVAVVTTSGTAAAELLPAMAEADSSGVPLIAVTADRPHRLRGSGAPQSIPQQNLFSDFAEASWDLEIDDTPSDFNGLSKLRPLHFNLAYEEPLLRDAELEPARIEKSVQSILERVRPKKVVETRTQLSASTDFTSAFSALSGWLARRPAGFSKGEGRVAIVAGLNAAERESVAKFLIAYRIPVLLEATSGLRGDARLKSIELIGGDQDLIRWCASKEIHSVLRIGGVPTTRFWRDLDEPETSVETLSISRLRFPGMDRGGLIELSLLQDWNAFFENATPSVGGTDAVDPGSNSRWFLQDQASAAKLEAALGAAPNSEPAFVRRLSEMVSENDLIYVGNSLPIRWWDLVATRRRCFAVEANRGVNGIDGQISTALGLAQARSSSGCAWILVGDLTALYDLSAPWSLLKSKNPAIRVRIVILNNSGGRIFSRVLSKAPSGAAPFENAHGLGFESWAKMWQLDYRSIHQSDELASLVSGTSLVPIDRDCVIELIPEAESTKRFWTEFS